MTAPATGLYIVSIGSADDDYTASGTYSLRATGIDPRRQLIWATSPWTSGRRYGIWIKPTGPVRILSGSKSTRYSPTKIARGDIDGSGMVSLIANFQGYGVWIWKSETGLDAAHNDRRERHLDW